MNKRAALEVLAFNKKTPESLIHTIPQAQHVVMKDKDNHAWTFTIRRRCYLYLLARCTSMANYEEIYKKL
jgi:hypothetical protein